MASLSSCLFLSAFLFATGLACVLIRRNTIQILMGIELIFNAAALNFVAFEHFTPPVEKALAYSGQVTALFIIVLAAAEAAVALALVLSVFRVFKTVDVSRVEELKG
ncbi:MAG: NADH-quinone oxidoreductase subunit NuoK [Pseudomonadota bacterium]